MAFKGFEAYGELPRYWEDQIIYPKVYYHDPRRHHDDFGIYEPTPWEHIYIRSTWEYETLLKAYAAPYGAIRTDYRKRREGGQLKFVCNECASGEHNNCILRNKDKISSDCDCQHKKRK